MKWATRPGVHVDRTACAWLIRRFIDPAAEFFFFNQTTDLPGDTIGFDMRGVELSHSNGECSFETILRRYEFEDPALWAIARIVHEADLEDERFDAPEARGVDILIRGMSMVADDAEMLDRTGHLFDGLYEYLGRDSTPDP